MDSIFNIPGSGQACQTLFEQKAALAKCLLQTVSYLCTTGPAATIGSVLRTFLSAHRAPQSHHPFLANPDRVSSGSRRTGPTNRALTARTSTTDAGLLEETHDFGHLVAHGPLAVICGARPVRYLDENIAIADGLGLVDAETCFSRTLPLRARRRVRPTDMSTRATVCWVAGSSVRDTHGSLLDILADDFK